MHLSDSEPDPWDRILARKADEAPAAVQQRDRTQRGWWMYAGAAMIVAAFIAATARPDRSGGPLKNFR